MLTKAEVERMRQAALFYRSEECEELEDTGCHTCGRRDWWGCKYGDVILLTARIAELEAIVEELGGNKYCWSGVQSNACPFCGTLVSDGEDKHTHGCLWLRARKAQE